MKKRIISLLLAAAMAVSMMACGAKNDNKAGTDAGKTEDKAQTEQTDGTETSDAEADRTQFIVGFDAEFPPYGYMDENGEYTGFDLELAQEVCDRNGWELVKKPINWDSKDMELNSGSIDCIWNGFTMNGRVDDYTWSDPYIENNIVVVVPSDSEVKELADLAGKIVSVQADSSGLSALEGDDATEENKALAESFAELQQVGDYNTAFMNLEAGAVDAVVLDIGVALYQLASRGDKFTMLEEQVSAEQYAVGFKQGNTSLRDKVQETLDAMAEEGKIEEIADKYADYYLSDMLMIGK